MGRLLARLAGIYFLFALIGRFVERIGAVQCDCPDHCWCRRPGISLFRWVFPYGHRCASAPSLENADGGWRPAR